MKRALLALIGLLLAGTASAAATQQNVQQSGAVTPGHIAKWFTSGIIGDAGTSLTPGITTEGILSNQACSFAISTALAPSPFTRLCFGVNTAGVSQISLNSFGGAPAPSLNFNINGTLYNFPFAVGGVVGPNTTVVGDVACWNNTVGSLLADCGPAGGGINPGPLNAIAFYAAAGNVVSGLPTANNAVLTTNGAGLPSMTRFISLPNNPTLSTSPTGNPTGGSLLTTFSTALFQGTTTNPSNREFLLNVGLTSNSGAGVANNNGDKVAFYVGAVGLPGTGNLWAMNPLLAQNAGSGSYTAQGME